MPRSGRWMSKVSGAVNAPGSRLAAPIVRRWDGRDDGAREDGVVSAWREMRWTGGVSEGLGDRGGQQVRVDADLRQLLGMVDQVLEEEGEGLVGGLGGGGRRAR